MNAHTENVTIIWDSKGHPDYVVMPYAVYQSLIDKQKLDTLIPAEVIRLSMIDDNISAVGAWRKHLDLTQDEVATRLGISQAAYSKLENSKRSANRAGKKLLKLLVSIQNSLIFEKTPPWRGFVLAFYHFSINFT